DARQDTSHQTGNGGMARDPPSPWATLLVAGDKVPITPRVPFLATPKLQPRPRSNDQFVPCGKRRYEPRLQRDSVQGGAVLRTELQGGKAAIWLPQDLQVSM